MEPSEESNLVENLRQLLNQPVVELNKFYRAYSPDHTGLHFFVEGNEDQAFYSTYVRQIFSEKKWEEMHYYPCQGKAAVYQYYSLINWNYYHKNRVLFFVDKDADDIIKISYPVDENIFSTMYFSIENYLVGGETLVTMLKEFCNINNNEILKKIEINFLKQRQFFLNKMLFFSAWIILCKIKNYPLIIRDIDLGKFFIIEDDFKIEIKGKKKKKKILSLFPLKDMDIPSGCWRDVLHIARQLSHIEDPKMYVRGKFELWFLVAYFKKLVEKSKAVAKVGTTVNIELNNAVAILAPRVKMPEDLRSFLLYHHQKLSS